MSRDQEIIEDLPAYALGALDDEDQRAVEELIERDIGAADELGEMLDTVARFSAQIGESAPPAQLRHRVISAAKADSDVVKEQSAFSSLVSHLERRITIEEHEFERAPKNGWQRLGGLITAGRLAFATSIASFVVVSIMAIQLGADNAELNRELTDMDRDVAAAYAYTQSMIEDISNTERMLMQAHDRISRQDQEIVRMSQINEALRSSMNDQISLTYATLRNEYESPEWQPEATLTSEGYFYLLQHQRKPLGALVIGGVEQAPPGEEYRLYLVGHDQAHYAASFDMNEAGYSTVLFNLNTPLESYNGAHITRERVIDPPDPSLASPENLYKPQ
jgi:anti-sigma-K factor RskA